jgi:hypothetical protein
VRLFGGWIVNEKPLVQEVPDPALADTIQSAVSVDEPNLHLWRPGDIYGAFLLWPRSLGKYRPD